MMLCNRHVITHITRRLTVAAALVTALCSPAFSASLQIETLRFEEGSLLASLSVRNYERTDIIEAVRRGIRVNLTYTIEIVEKSALGFLYANTVMKKTIHRSARFDFWNRSYTVREGSAERNTNSESEMLDMLFTLRNQRLDGALRFRSERFYARFKADMKSVELYFPMNYIFRYFVGFWDFNTGWVRSPALGDL